jgi:hypothetical protein
MGNVFLCTFASLKGHEDLETAPNNVKSFDVKESEERKGN